MRRGAKPAKAKVEAKLPVARKSRKSAGSRVHDLEKSLAEVLEQQTATSEILSVISSSPTDLQPVFDTIAERSLRLCGGLFSSVYRFDGELIHMVAHHNYPPVALERSRQLFPTRPGRHLFTARAILERSVVLVTDVMCDPDWEAHDIARAAGFRSVLAVPMLRGDDPIGSIVVWRTDVGPFSEKQIALLKTFADQAVIAIENVRLFKELESRNRDLTTALDRQTATADMLRIIAQSPTELQPVLDAIAASAVRLCEASDAVIERLEGDRFYNAAHAGAQMKGLVGLPLPLTRRFPGGRAVLDRQRVILDDIHLVAEREYPDTLELLKLNTIHSVAEIPLLSEGKPLGSLAVLRAEVRPFTDAEVSLLETFADQAVIAIENVRLFKELQEKNQALTAAHAQTSEALEQQTATSEILRVISSSPTGIQPVFEAIVRFATTLCEADLSGLFPFDGDLIHFGAQHGRTPDEIAAAQRAFPQPPSRLSVTARAILAATVVQVADVSEDPEVADPLRLYRTVLSVPMIRDDRPMGAITVARRAVRPFTDKQIALLQTFADQAVIAIENVRLFTELQASNRELTTALDTQTATSDILRVISHSQTDVQPVFDAIVESAVRLLGAYSGGLTRITGDQIELAALTSTDAAGDAATRARYPEPLQSEGMHAQAIRERAPVNIADAHTDPGVPEAQRAFARVRGFRSWVVVPMLRHDAAVGAIAVTRRDPGGFTDDEIALLQTFADQAVIAIENARLLSELQARTQELTRSVGELQALGEVGQAISSTLDLQTVLSTIVARATQLADVDAGVIYEYDEQREIFDPRATERLEGDIVQMLVATPVRKGQGATGRLAEVRQPIQVADVRDLAEQVPVRDAFVRAGYRALLAVPLVREDHLIGALTVFRKTPGEFAPGTVDLLRTFATQSALAIQNARLFREIADKSRQLEVASQHKSEFLANMSHELRTPLNAIIGFSEVLTERMFGELNEKQAEYLQDIYASGTHLLSLINDILDLSKIEAGRMELELTDFDLPTALDNALILVRERAGRRSITLEAAVDQQLGEVRADERKIRQVVLNLLSNAIKFTPEGGRIEVRAVPVDGAVEVCVSDTGVGIAPEDQEAVFEEFRQVGTAEKKAEGTGLGLTLCRKFVELHGGRIWVKSEVGVGSTFSFTLPVRHGR